MITKFIGKKKSICLSKKHLALIIGFLLLSWRPGILSSESLVMTSYYPAPYGGYNELFTTGSTYLARNSGNVYFGKDDNILHRNGNIQLKGDSPKLKFANSSDSITIERKYTSGFLGLFTTPYLNIDKDLKVNSGSVLRNACFSKKYSVKEGGSTTYCGDASKKFFVVQQAVANVEITSSSSGSGGLWGAAIGGILTGTIGGAIIGGVIGSAISGSSSSYVSLNIPQDGYMLCCKVGW